MDDKREQKETMSDSKSINLSLTHLYLHTHNDNTATPTSLTPIRANPFDVGYEWGAFPNVIYWTSSSVWLSNERLICVWFIDWVFWQCFLDWFFVLLFFMAVSFTWFSLLRILSWSLINAYLAASSFRSALSFFNSGLQNVCWLFRLVVAVVVVVLVAQKGRFKHRTQRARFEQYQFFVSTKQKKKPGKE